MSTRSRKKLSSRANALRRGEINAERRGGALRLKKSAASACEAEPVRDGLLWLIKKDRLSASRRVAAAAYRDLYREPQEGAMRSCLNDEVRGSGSGRPPDYNAGKVDAARRLTAMRTQALASHQQMIEVMDGVCGGGLTLRELAGGEERAAGRLEAVLMIALDLVAAWLARHSVAA
jgi:hypothetical protein